MLIITKNKQFLFFTGFILFALTGVASADYTIGNGQLNISYYSVMSNITNAADLSCVSYSQKIYCFGGYDNISGNPTYSLNYTQVYDPSTNTWTRKKDMPTAYWGGVAVLLNSSVYVFHSGTPVQIYNIFNDSWTTGTTSVTDNLGAGLEGIVYNNKIYLFYNSYTYKYYPDNDTYYRLANDPVPTYWATLGLVNDRIYIISGYSTSATEVYNITTNTWSSKAAPPRNTYGKIRENPVYDRKIYDAFGQSYQVDGVFYTWLFVYDTDNDSWTGLPMGIHPRDGLSGGFISDKLYIVGGRDHSPSIGGLGWNEKYDPDVQTNAWLNSTLSNITVDNFSQNIILVGTQNNTNIALNQNAWSDSVQDSGYLASYAVDGDTGTYWVSTDYPNYPVNWTVDLGSNYSLYNIKAYQSGLSAYLIGDYEIWVSNDNITYTKIINKTAPIGTSTNSLAFSINKTFYARYINVRIYSNTTYTSGFGVGISEFQAYKLDSYNQGNLTVWSDAGSGNMINSVSVNETSGHSSSVSNYSVYYRQNNTGSFTLLASNQLGNNTYSLSPNYQNTDILVQLFGNGISTPEILGVTFWSSLIDTSFTVTLPSGETQAWFNASSKTQSNVPGRSQNNTIGFLYITNTGNAAENFYFNVTAALPSGVTLKANINNQSSGATVITISQVKIISNLATSSSQYVWLWADFNNANLMNVNRTLQFNSSQ